MRRLPTPPTLILMIVLVACGDGRTELGVPSSGDVVVPPMDARFEDVGSTEAGTAEASVDSSSSCGFQGDPSAAAVTEYGSCGEGMNLSEPFQDGTSAGTQFIAFEYVPQVDLMVSRIELHSVNGVVGLLDSNCEKPGKPLFVGSLGGPTNTPSWLGIDVSPPIAVHAHHRYFIIQRTAPSFGSLSITSSGLKVREYVSSHFDGPWMGNGGVSLWTVRVIGKCP